MALIEIENMEFYAYHGCFTEEQEVGNGFSVNLLCEADTQKAQQSDSLADTINYQTLYQLVKREMQITSKLLEHVAERIVRALHEQFPELTRIRIKVSKLNPPLGGKIDRVSVTLEKTYTN